MSLSCIPACTAAPASDLQMPGRAEGYILRSLLDLLSYASMTLQSGDSKQRLAQGQAEGQFRCDRQGEDRTMGRVERCVVFIHMVECDVG